MVQERSAMVVFLEPVDGASADRDDAFWLASTIVGTAHWVGLEATTLLSTRTLPGGNESRKGVRATFTNAPGTAALSVDEIRSNVQTLLQSLDPDARFVMVRSRVGLLSDVIAERAAAKGMHLAEDRDAPTVARRGGEGPHLDR